jgi:tRNA (mo5U34)-methyltransferase
MVAVTTAPEAPPVPPGFNAEEFFQGRYWHQRWQIFDGVYTPGINSIEFMLDSLGAPKDLTGKRVLDVGAWHGCVSFECERRGAAEVVALDPSDPEGAGFCQIAEAIGSTRVRHVKGTVYNLDPKQFGYFDVVFFCGVLYHLRYPMLGIDNLRRVCVGEVFTETHVLDDQVVLPNGKGLKQVPLRQLSSALADTPVWQFYRTNELCNDASNWFAPNCAAVIQSLESAGFETKLVKHYKERATFHSKVRQGPPEWLSLVCGESFYYDTLVSHLYGGERPGTRP